MAKAPLGRVLSTMDVRACLITICFGIVVAVVAVVEELTQLPLPALPVAAVSIVTASAVLAAQLSQARWLRRAAALLCCGFAVLGLGYVLNGGPFPPTRIAAVLLLLGAMSCALRGLPEFTCLVTRTRARSVIRMQEYHTARIAGELHDEVLQALALTSRRLDDARRSDELAVIRITLMDAVDVLNEQSAVVGDIVSTLHPAVLRHVGLTDAIDTLAHHVAVANGLTVTVAIIGDPQPHHTADSEVSTAAYRVVQEALTNVVKHAAATIVNITLEFERNQLVITVSDDGRGVNDLDRRRSTGFGLENMRWRCETYGGSFALRNSDTGGTLVHATFPAS